MYSQGPVPQYRAEQPILRGGVGEPSVVLDDQMKLIDNSIYAGRQSIINGSCQIILAVICIVINSVSLGLEPDGYGIISQGIWGGAMYLTAGILGIMAGTRNTRCLIIAFFVLCILNASLISPGAAIASEFGFSFFVDDPDSGFGAGEEYKTWRLASQITLLILAVIEFGFAMWGCVICGMILCNCYAQGTVPMDTSSPYHSGNFASQIPVGQQQYGQGQKVYPGSENMPGAYAYQSLTVVYEGYHSLQSWITGVAQIIIGVLLIAFNSTLTAILPYEGLGVASHGYWGGMAFIATGVFGVTAALSRTRCPVMTYMIMSILSIPMAVAVLIIAALSIHLEDLSCYGSDGQYYCNGNKEANLAMNVLMIVLAALEGIFAIWASVLGAKVICSCCRPYSSNTFRSTDQVLVNETINNPAFQNHGYHAPAGSVTLGYPYNPAQVGSYTLPGSQMKIQP